MIKMVYKRTLNDVIDGLGDGAVYVLKKGVKYGIGICIGFYLLSHNGFLDSDRTKQAEQLHNANNPTKVVASVNEKWSDNSMFALASSMIGGGGYNPRVIREVIFEDGSQTTLDYRVLAHQPFVRWMAGEEFNPKVGERYEVTKNNQLVRPIK
ncbi:MAG: hypothetical protein WC916_07805 [Candidatus Woesearchaeota archaeon]